MRKYLAALVAILSLALPAQASAECPDPARPYHQLPFCLTQTEYLALTTITNINNPATISVGPVGQWEPLVRKYWPAELVPWALAIIECESNGDEWAKNPRSTAAGLFQFLRSTWDRGPAPALGLPAYWTGAPYVAEWNIQAAAWLYDHWGGKSQWQCKA